tara:strand:+ start:280 stop:663 length:384 start_codon:yes stop_codon:yes gene_type:complete
MSGTNIVWKGDVEIDVVKRDSLTMMEYQANKQIDLLKRQAELLMKQVKEIQDRVELAHLVAQAKYNFKPVLMKEYYLYKHNENDYTLCLISPEEWGDGCPYGECTARVRQLGDSTWEEVIPEETEDE